jgi:hypothetical protein
MELHKEGDFVGRINISADEYNSITYEKNINCETFADDKTYYSIDMEMLKKQQELLWQKIKR